MIKTAYNAEYSTMTGAEFRQHLPEYIRKSMESLRTEGHAPGVVHYAGQLFSGVVRLTGRRMYHVLWNRSGGVLEFKFLYS